MVLIPSEPPPPIVLDSDELDPPRAPRSPIPTPLSESEEIRLHLNKQTNRARKDATDLWVQDAWAFMSGTDPDTGKPLIWTTDERDDRHPIKPFPCWPMQRILVDAALNSPRMFVDKTRQLMVTTTLTVLMLWYILFKESRYCLISKSKEEESATVLEQKLVNVYCRLPEWVKKTHPLKVLSTTVTALNTNSVIRAVSQNLAQSELRGPTVSILLVDEAAFQDRFAKILRAATSNTAHLWPVSTPEVDNPGGLAMRSCVQDPDDPAATPRILPGVDYTGVTVRQTVRGFTVLHIDDEARPDRRDAAYHVRVRREYDSETDYLREHKRDWNTPSGGLFYSEYARNGGDETYVRSIPGILPSPVIVGLDFGHRFPAAVWMQAVPEEHLLVVLRAIIPPRLPKAKQPHISVQSFRDLVMYLNGLVPIDSLDVVARWWLGYVQTDEYAVPTPWFSPSTEFIYHGSHEAMTERAEVAKETPEKCAADWWMSAGIVLSAHKIGVKSREVVMRGLLRKHPKTRSPSIVFDQSTKNTAVMCISTGIVFKEPSAADPDPERRKKDGYWDNLDDAMGYAIINCLNMDEWELPVQVPVGGMLEDREALALSTPERQLAHPDTLVTSAAAVPRIGPNGPKKDTGGFYKW